MKWITTTMSLCALLLLTGCVSSQISQFAPPPGFIVTSYDAPLCLDMDETVTLEENGDASGYFIWDVIFTGLNVAWGDCSLNRAIKNGDDIPIGAADYHHFSVLGIYRKTTITVYK